MTPDQVIAQLQGLALDSKKAMQAAELKVATAIADDARENVPTDLAGLAGSIGVEQDDKETTVYVGAPYAPFVEFGTGDTAHGGFAEAYVKTLPVEWQEEAIQFFVNGEGHQQPQPYFYPAVFKHQNDLEDAIGQELQKLTE